MKRTHKVLVAVGVVAFTLSLTMIAGQAPREYLSVEDVRGDAPSGEVQIVAVVVPGTIEQTDDGLTRFQVRGETNATMNVTYDEGLTDAFGADKWVILTGTVTSTAAGTEIRADDVQIGCPSKWQSEKAEV